MAAMLAEQVLGPVLSSVQVKKVRTKTGRRFEAPRILWNVYEAELEMPGGVEAKQLFWTKAYFNDEDCEDYRSRIGRLLQSQNGNPLDPQGFARFFPELNMFMFFFPTDPVFPKLGKVSATASVQPLLLDHFKKMRPGVEIQSVTASLVKYLPEISCILRYEAEVGEERPLTLYGKVQHSRRGAMTYQVMKALWDLPARANGDLVLAEPLAYYPNDSLLLQSEIPGDEVKGDRHSEVFLRQCEVAGRMIGHIHASGIDVGEPHTVDVEIDRIYKRLEEFKLSAPRVYMLLRDLLKQITAKAQKLPPEAPVPSHGDYKYNQFLFDGQNYGMIDVEYFVQAEPSFDLGKYCGHLWPASPKDWSDTAQAREARRIFLDAYLAVRPEYDGRRFAIYEALSLATRALVVTWSQGRNAAYMAETLTALGYEQLKMRWRE
ncbi:MAG: phosphotransferase [Candidatus Dormibacteraeota bacterium]|nr:phosphotransferase [Candidatus Dormibacteraeota bacterium]